MELPLDDLLTVGLDPSSTTFGVSLCLNGEIVRTLTIKPPSENEYYARYRYVMDFLEQEILPLGQGELGTWYSSAIEEPPPAQQSSALLYPYYFGCLDLFRENDVPMTFAFAASRLKSLILNGRKTWKGEPVTGSAKNPIREMGAEYFGWIKLKNSHETEASYLADLAYLFRQHLDGVSELTIPKYKEVLCSTKVIKKKRKFGKTVKTIEHTQGMRYNPNKIYFNWAEFEIIR